MVALLQNPFQFALGVKFVFLIKKSYIHLLIFDLKGFFFEK